jgi:hypothetical protein
MGRKQSRRSEKEATSGADPSPPSPTRIFISYAHAEPDQALAAALKVGLVQAGHRVYLATLRHVIRHGTVPDDDAFVRLSGAGLVRREGDKIVTANGLYARFFGDLP